MIQNLSRTMILKFKYDTEEECEQHIKEMELLGYECTGQLKKSAILTANAADFYWYGEFSQEVLPSIV